MADQATTTKDETTVLTVPPEVAEKFGDLVDLIRESGSMEDDERQYWVDVLPIMSNDQVENLRSILENEKKQLNDAAQTYSNGMEKAVKNVANEFNEQAYLEKKRAREEAERRHEEEERQREADVLKELENL